LVFETDRFSTYFISYNPPSGNNSGTTTNGSTSNSSSAISGVLKISFDKIKHMPYIFGYPDGTVRPDQGMTRAEVVVMLSRLLDEKMDPNITYNSKFTDVLEGQWFANYIGYMERFEIIKGYVDGTFRPENNISRAEFTTIMARFQKIEFLAENSFEDIEELEWAKAYINSAYKNGWIQGYPDGSFRPLNIITRAEVVTIVNKVLGRYCTKEYLVNVGARNYSDLNMEHWAYWGMIEATVEHESEHE